MAHGILNSTFERKGNSFYWVIHVATEAHGEIVKIKPSLNSDIHDYTNTVID